MPDSQWITAYMRHHTDGSATHDSLEGAVNFLRYGEEEGDHSAQSITDPDGATVWSREGRETIWEFAERVGVKAWWDGDA